MEWEKKEISPETLPFYADWPDDCWGSITRAESVCPGVYYLNARQEGLPFGREYYAVLEDAEAVCREARTYGAPLSENSGVRLFEAGPRDGGWEIVEYEIEKYRLSHGGQPQKNFTLHGAAVYGMELYPGYFGEYPVPFATPMGYTCRHKRIDNGIYWIETDRQESCLAAAYPYSDEFSGFAQKLAVRLREDEEKGLEQTLGYLFFPQKVYCIPLFELMEYRNWDAVVDRAALMNAIWDGFPEYAAAYNAREQSGQHDLLGVTRILLGEAGVRLRGSPDFVISVTPDAGRQFFRFL